MILPIGHDRAVYRFPWLTLAIIAACTLMQVYATVVAPGSREIEEFLAFARDAQSNDAMIEAHAKQLMDRIPILRWGYETGSGINYRLITSGFVHDGWLHLIGNMLFLWLAGSALEDRLGRIRWGLLYFLGEGVATWCFEATYSGTPVMLVGASGAVSAAMGAFLVYFAKTEITLWYFIMYRTGTFRMAAYWALPLWLIEQIIYAMLAHGTPGLERVAYAAHIGGFGFGFGVALLASFVWPRRGDDEHDERHESAPKPSAAESMELSRDAQLDARYQRCFDALAARDLGTIRTLASRTIIDLDRDGDYHRIAELHEAISNSGLPVPYTDKASHAVTVALTHR